ncbi:hypothetical protein AGR4A_pAt30188 [Agrobacterium tumefaciens str. B6]|uniref:Uncharacterized protein n=1 Tax=Agrobacterium tumefaciens str. B6 TaxID=1183423 RepID=A0A822VDB4_AGRTU|nr:hypothetical protein AGR4A_pAt30188 [Agrobacterium tumefaciens str. B6]
MLEVIPGRKPSSNPAWISPYLQEEEIASYLADVKRLAYAETAYLTAQFRDSSKSDFLGSKLSTSPMISST